MKDRGLEPFFDQSRLKTDAYADSTNLTARADIYRFAEPNVPFPQWALSHLPEDPGKVLDVGCGPGFYLEELHRAGRASQLVGMDLSDGMLRDVPHGIASLCVADAQHLPFRHHSFDTVLCMHVLYHVPDIFLAVTELRRVVKPGGYVLVATNGSQHHRRLRELFDEVLSELTGRSVASVLGSERRFRLEDRKRVLEKHFESIERFDQLREIAVPKPEPLVRYLASNRSFHEARLPEEVTWSHVVKAFRGRVTREIDEKGAFRSPVHEGVFVCR